MALSLISERYCCLSSKSLSIYFWKINCGILVKYYKGSTDSLLTNKFLISHELNASLGELFQRHLIALNILFFQYVVIFFYAFCGPRLGLSRRLSISSQILSQYVL